MFSQLCVKNSVQGGGVHLSWPGRHPWLGRHPPWPVRHPPGQADTPPADSYCSRRYASYWNAFLLFTYFYATMMFQYAKLLCLFPYLLMLPRFQNVLQKSLKFRTVCKEFCHGHICAIDLHQNNNTQNSFQVHSTY